MFGAIAGGIASALAGGAMSKLFGGGQKAASGGIQGDVLATDNNTVDLAAEGRKANDSHADCYQYFCVPEYGTANGRLHFHAVHFMRTLPTGSVDPNFG